MARKKSHEEFVEQVYDLVGDEYEVIGTYVNSGTPIKLKHIICKHEYEVTPGNFLRGQRCPECKKMNMSLKYRKSHEQFVLEVIEHRGDIYDFLTKYETQKVKIKIRHRECNNEWYVKPSNLIHRGEKGKVLCPNCNGGVKTLDTDRYKEKINEIVGDEYIVLGDHVNSQTPIKMKHNTECCLHVFYASPAGFITKESRCPKCYGNVRKTTDEFKKQVYDLEGENYLVIGEYVNSGTHIKMKHNANECNHIFDVLPSNFIKNGGTRCPKCKSYSKGEDKIEDFLFNNHINYKGQFSFEKLKNNKVLRFDFAILNGTTDLHYLIEYDGEQHFKPVDFAGKGEEYALEAFIKTQHNDQIKNQYCKDNDIKLYRIPYWKFDEIEDILYKLIHNEHVEVNETSFLVV